jgi:hypothetical protein
MMEDWAEALDAWHDFYLLVGTAGATLTGLLFVLVSLAPHLVARNAQTGVKAFISPIAVYFTFAMVASALMLAPGLARFVLAACLAGGGLGGMFYMSWTRAHERWRRENLPTLDLIWFVLLPLLAFALTFSAGSALALHMELGLLGVAAATVLLLVVGIRNAWDIVVWMTHQTRTRDGAE